MTEYSPLRSEVFVLRLWQETSSGTWRGQVVQMSNGVTISFATWDQLRAILGRFVGGLEAGPDRPQGDG